MKPISFQPIWSLLPPYSLIAKKPEDRHLPHEIEKSVAVDRAESLVLIIDRQIREHFVTRKLCVERFEPSACGIKLRAHLRGEGLVEKMDDTGLGSTRGVGRRNDACGDGGEIGGFGLRKRCESSPAILRCARGFGNGEERRNREACEGRSRHCARSQEEAAPRQVLIILHVNRLVEVGDV